MEEKQFVTAGEAEWKPFCVQHIFCEPYLCDGD